MGLDSKFGFHPFDSTYVHNTPFYEFGFCIVIGD